MKRLWLFMCVVGTVIPYAVFIPWALKNGLDMHLLLDQATPPIAAFAWLDVVVAAMVVLVLAINKSLPVRAGSGSLSSEHLASACPWACRSIFTSNPNPHYTLSNKWICGVA